MPAARAALAGWTFSGELRHYQADVLDRVSVRTEDPLHIVAPPGSGKTLLGLLLAVERGARTLVLAPTLTVRRQWADAATALSPDPAQGPDPAQVSEDPDVLADLTALTYQVLSVLDTANPLAGLARARWCEELEVEGRSAESAAAWVADLARTNPDAYRSGIARRSRRLRRRLAREDADFLVAAPIPGRAICWTASSRTGSTRSSSTSAITCSTTGRSWSPPSSPACATPAGGRWSSV
ncbi:DEAD/DEAH box helicase family protein [Microbacterium aurantiacum]|uniref:DEAD/DEAH box helicase family protein n=1 Tax=Microbacterium aurantiacum TaxID=162393 RepID=UPI0007DA635E|nr:DEAD/DEAH box helicase family protein [Microbacterium chocolatum]ANG84018.1 hypothetical protein A8L33_00010 [Microbacterium chocolatum]